MNRSKKSRSRRAPRQPESRFMTRAEINGGAFKPPTNPPPVTYAPWQPVTLVLTHSSDLTMKVEDLLGYLRSQLDPNNRGFNQTKTGDGRFVVQFRFRSVSSWNLTGRVISLSVEDFTDIASSKTGRDQLCGLVDTGTSTHTPAVGFRIPSSLANHVLRTDDVTGQSYLFTITAPAGSQCVTYLKVYYRFDGPVKHPTIISPLTEIESTLEAVASKITQAKERSTIEFVIDGIKYAAEAVAVVGQLRGNQCACTSRTTDEIRVERVSSGSPALSCIARSFDSLSIDGEHCNKD